MRQPGKLVGESPREFKSRPPRFMLMEKKFCPVCGSEKIVYGVLGTTANYYKCNHCGYRGPIIIEDGKLSEKLREKYEKEKED